MTELSLNIVQFIQDPDVLNDQSHSELQLTILKSTYGLPLNDQELEIYERCTGRKYDAREQSEVTLISGRRGGKTIKIAAPIVVYEAFRDHGLPPGEEGYVVLLAPTIAQARIAFRAIRNYLRRSRTLSKRVVSTTKDEIKLDNGVTIATYACTYDGVRGRTIIACVCDEIGFWSDAETAANPAEEVIAALLPGMSTVKNAKLVKISTPFRKDGLLWREFQQRLELDFPVWQVSSQEMNPTLNSSMLERDRRRSEEKYRREYLAEFTDSVTSWIAPEILDPCIARGRTELPHVRSASYAAALDPATRHNDFALAILHIVPDGTMVVDRVVRWTGTKQAPLGYEFVLGEVKSILDQYGINTVVGDQYYSDVISQHLLKLGILYELSTFSSKTRAKIFSNLKHLLVQRKIEILDEPQLLRELRGLQELKTERGEIDIRPSGGMRDDSAVAVALAASELAKRACVPPLEISSGRSNKFPFLNLNPFNCACAAICAKMPQCQDQGHCLGFTPEGHTGPVYLPR